MTTNGTEAGRPRCSVFIATSLDGRIARADGGLDWLERVARPGEDHGYGEFWGSVDALAIGRRTYETALGFDEWPYRGKRCVVLTHRALTPRHDEEAHAGDPAPLLARLHAEGVRRVYVDGGEVIRGFLRAGLIDDLTISLVPVVLGEGPPLFEAPLPETALTLVSTRSYDSGLVQLTYHRPSP